MGFPPSPAPLTDIARILAVFAHPDDVDFGAAATVARWVADGLEVEYLVVTHGETGGFDDTPRVEIPRIRAAEQRAAAAAVGVRRVTFLNGYIDGAVYLTHPLRRDISRAIRRFQPDRVLTHSPLRRWTHLGGPGHPDHLAVGEAACAAIYPDARNPFAHPELLDEGLEPWTVREVWFTGGPDPDHFVDVTETVDQKLAAIRAHTSQITDPAGLEQRIRGFLATNAATAGLPEGHLAEAFTIVRSE